MLSTNVSGAINFSPDQSGERGCWEGSAPAVRVWRGGAHAHLPGVSGGRGGQCPVDFPPGAGLWKGNRVRSCAVWKPECSMQNEPPWPGPLLASDKRQGWVGLTLYWELPSHKLQALDLGAGEGRGCQIPHGGLRPSQIILPVKASNSSSHRQGPLPCLRTITRDPLFAWLRHTAQRRGDPRPPHEHLAPCPATTKLITLLWDQTAI